MLQIYCRTALYLHFIIVVKQLLTLLLFSQLKRVHVHVVCMCRVAHCVFLLLISRDSQKMQWICLLHITFAKWFSFFKLTFFSPCKSHLNQWPLLHTYTVILIGNLESSINLICMFLDGRNLENMQTPCYQATMLTTKTLCCQNSKFMRFWEFC